MTMKRIIVSLFLLLSSFGALAANTTGTPIPSASYTATTFNSGDQFNSDYKGGHFIVNVSAFVSGTYTVHIQGKDPLSGNYYDLVVSTALGATGTTVLKVYPGITASANVSVSDLVPQTWRVQLVGASTPSMTLSVSFVMEP